MDAGDDGAQPQSTLPDILMDGITGSREEVLKKQHVGSQDHPHGCRPCHFQVGLCCNGLACSLCHTCPKPKRKSKHQRDVDRRRQERYQFLKEEFGSAILTQILLSSERSKSPSLLSSNAVLGDAWQTCLPSGDSHESATPIAFEDPILGGKCKVDMRLRMDQATSGGTSIAPRTRNDLLQGRIDELLEFISDMVGAHPDERCVPAEVVLRMPLLNGPLAAFTSVSVSAFDTGRDLRLSQDIENVRSFCKEAGTPFTMNGGSCSKSHWKEMLKTTFVYSVGTVHIAVLCGHGNSKGVAASDGEITYEDIKEAFLVAISGAYGRKFLVVVADFCSAEAFARCHFNAVGCDDRDSAQIAVIATAGQEAWETSSGGMLTQCLVDWLAHRMPLGAILREWGCQREGTFITRLRLRTFMGDTLHEQFGCASFPKQWRTTLERLEG